MYSSKIEVPPDRIVEKELNVRGSFAYNDEFPMVIELLASGLRSDPSIFISHEFALEDFAARSAAARPRVSLKVLVRP